MRAGYSAAKFLLNSGVPVRVDGAHAIAHNKVMIIDGETVVTGSFNFTKAAAEKNAENLLVIHDPSLAKLYTQNWNEHAAHSQAFTADAGISSTGKIPAPDAGASPDPEAAQGAIVGNRRSHIYAWPGCGTYDTMAPENRVVFPRAQAAEAAGYRPSGNCP